MNKISKKTAEKIISKYFHKEWKNSYIGLIWKNLKNNVTFCVTNRIGIIKCDSDSDYSIFFNKKDF